MDRGAWLDFQSPRAFVNGLAATGKWSEATEEVA